ncbi:MAG: hypothetical protein MPW14_03490 [Candidatus Manganitrophus sp.]|nr:MAG: hypothetical protein MPW14_03490 [Candidatus Manganitrophus sp.]
MAEGFPPPPPDEPPPAAASDDQAKRDERESQKNTPHKFLQGKNDLSSMEVIISLKIDF